MGRVVVIVVGLILLANVPWVLLVLTGVEVTDENRSWMYGLLMFAAVAALLVLGARATVRKIRGRSPVMSSVVVASSVALAFALMAAFQLASLQPGRPEIAAALQNFIVAVTAGIWWLRTRSGREQHPATPNSS